MTTKSTGAYAPDKALAHQDRLQQLRTGRQPYPVHLHLVISDLCNLDCPGCAYRLSGYSSNQLFNGTKPDGTQTRNPKRMLSTNLVKSILDDCAVMGTKAVEFTGGGEPTVHPDAAELLEYAQAKGLDTALITNGLNLPEKMGAFAVRTKWLRISVDAATPLTFAKVRPGWAGESAALREGKYLNNARNFYRALDAVEYAVATRAALKADCLIGVGFVVQRENWHEILDAARLYKSLGADNIRISAAFTPDGADYHAEYREEAGQLAAAAAKELTDERFTVHNRFHEKMADLSARPDYATCWYQNFTTYIGGDGNLYRCCVTSYNRQGFIGNVAEAGGFRQLWESATKKELFAGFDARTCHTCQFNDRNKAIDAAATATDLPAAPAEVIHKNFV